MWTISPAAYSSCTNSGLNDVQPMLMIFTMTKIPQEGKIGHISECRPLMLFNTSSKNVSQTWPCPNLFILSKYAYFTDEYDLFLFCLLPVQSGTRWVWRNRGVWAESGRKTASSGDFVVLCHLSSSICFTACSEKHHPPSANTQQQFKRKMTSLKHYRRVQRWSNPFI